MATLHRSISGSFRTARLRVRALVDSLLMRSGPAYIAWLIVAIVVFTVESRALWTWAKLGKELLKGLKPELDTTAAVLGIFRKVRIGASRLCHVVRGVFTGGSSADGVTVPRDRGTGADETTLLAFSGRAVAKVAKGYIADRSALAAARPHRHVAPASRRSENDPIAEYLSSNIESPGSAAAFLASPCPSIEKVRASNDRRTVTRTLAQPHVRSSLALSGIAEDRPLTEYHACQVFEAGPEGFWNAMILLSHVGFTSHVKSLSVRLGRGVSALRRAVSILPPTEGRACI